MSSGRRAGLRSIPGTYVPRVRSISTSVISVTPSTTTREARNRRATYFASISSYTKSPAAFVLPPFELLAIRDPHAVVPGPLRELVEGPEVCALDPGVDAIDAGVEEDHRRRLQV